MRVKSRPLLKKSYIYQTKLYVLYLRGHVKNELFVQIISTFGSINPATIPMIIRKTAITIKTIGHINLNLSIAKTFY